MIHPDKIGMEAKKREDENYKFRSFLKGHADEEELDKQFLRLHKELFADYDCNKCRNCCKCIRVVFRKRMLKKMRNIWVLQLSNS